LEVEISKLPKDEEAKLHTKTIQKNTHNNIFIYTDASSTSVRGSTGIGIGIAVFTHICNNPPPKDDQYRRSRVSLQR
jgi:hypothetical protein